MSCSLYLQRRIEQRVSSRRKPFADPQTAAVREGMWERDEFFVSFTSLSAAPFLSRRDETLQQPRPVLPPSIYARTCRHRRGSVVTADHPGTSARRRGAE